MMKALAPVVELLISVSILLTGQGLQGTLLPVCASLEDFSALSIGVKGAAYFFGFTVGCLRAGELLRHVGHVRVFPAMNALASAAPLIHGLIIQPISRGSLRMLTGFCIAVLYVAIESWLNERTSNENRGIIFSTYAMITLTVMAAGQMVTLLYEPNGLQLFVIATVLVSIGAMPVALSISPTPEQPLAVAVGVRHPFKISHYPRRKPPRSCLRRIFIRSQSTLRRSTDAYKLLYRTPSIASGATTRIIQSHTLNNTGLPNDRSSASTRGLTSQPTNTAIRMPPKGIKRLAVK